MSQVTVLTDEQIIAVATASRAAEPGDNGYILPISFARAIIAAHEAAKDAAMNAAIADLKQALAISEAKHALTKLIMD